MPPQTLWTLLLFHIPKKFSTKEKKCIETQFKTVIKVIFFKKKLKSCMVSNCLLFGNKLHPPHTS